MILLRKGLYSKSGLQLFSGQETGARIGDTGSEIDCTTVADLLNDYAIRRLDILKMDIEGAERAIFESHTHSWLSVTRLLVIETHGAEIEAVVRAALASEGLLMDRFRNLWYCYRDNHHVNVRLLFA